MPPVVERVTILPIAIISFADRGPGIEAQIANSSSNSSFFIHFRS